MSSNRQYACHVRLMMTVHARKLPNFLFLSLSLMHYLYTTCINNHARKKEQPFFFFYIIFLVSWISTIRGEVHCLWISAIRGEVQCLVTCSVSTLKCPSFLHCLSYGVGCRTRAQHLITHVQCLLQTVMIIAHKV